VEPDGSTVRRPAPARSGETATARDHTLGSAQLVPALVGRRRHHGRSAAHAFGPRWAAHDVRLHHTGTKRFRHALPSDLSVGFNATELAADPGLTLTVYTAEPASDSVEKLALLAS
jgi:transcription regulator MmyB-like protein